VLPSTRATPRRASLRSSPLLDSFCRPRSGLGAITVSTPLSD